MALCADCGSEITRGKQRRFIRTHLCRDCNGEMDADYMPTLEQIEVAALEQREARVGQMQNCTQSKSLFMPRVAKVLVNSRCKLERE